MTENYKVLGQAVSYPSSYQEVVAYEVPEGKQASISTIEITNAGNSTIDYKINAVPAADVPDTITEEAIDGDGIPGLVGYIYQWPTNGKFSVTSDLVNYTAWADVPIGSDFAQTVKFFEGAYYGCSNGQILKSLDLKTWTIIHASQWRWQNEESTGTVYNTFKMHFAKNKLSMFISQVRYNPNLTRSIVVVISQGPSYSEWNEMVLPPFWQLFPSPTWTPWGDDNIFTTNEKMFLYSGETPYNGPEATIVTLNVNAYFVFDETRNYELVNFNTDIDTDGLYYINNITKSKGKYFISGYASGKTYVNNFDSSKTILYSTDLNYWNTFSIRDLNDPNDPIYTGSFQEKDGKVYILRTGNWLNNGSLTSFFKLPVIDPDTMSLEFLPISIISDQIDQIYALSSDNFYFDGGLYINVARVYENLSYSKKLDLSNNTLSGTYSSIPFEFIPITPDPLVYGTKITSKKKHNIISSSIGSGINNEIKGGITLSSGDRITIAADSSDVIINLYGVEIE
jgi:hypothetical protein